MSVFFVPRPMSDTADRIRPPQWSRRLAALSVAALLGFACSSSSPPADGDDGGSSGTGASAGVSTGGASTGGASTGGAPTGGAPTGGASSGTSNAGSSSGASAGMTNGGSPASGGAGGVGAGSGGSSGASAGMTNGGSSASGGAGGTSGSGGSSGASAGSGGFVAGGVRFVGRVDASNAQAVRFAWSGSGLVATVQGTKISVRLQTEATSAIFYQPVIDGTARPRFQVTSGAAQTVVLGDNLAAGSHRVEVYRESEGNYGTSVFLGFADGTVLGAPAATRLIEIVGDSISAGYGNLGNDVHPPWDVSCPFSLDTESAYQAYGWALARSLGADASIIARSGWGIYRDNTGSTANVLPSIYENTLGSQNTPRWDFARKPDAVVVNLGTNDSAGTMGDPGVPYENAYVAFLRTVRSRYPNAWIFLTLGPMTSDPLLTTMRTHLDNVVTRLADAKVIHVPLPVQNAASTGCDFHPNVAEDQRMAATLKTSLQMRLGW